MLWLVSSHTYFAGRSGGEAEGGLSFAEPVEQAIEVAAGERPLEGLGDLFVVTLERK